MYVICVFSIDYLYYFVCVLFAYFSSNVNSKVCTLMYVYLINYGYSGYTYLQLLKKCLVRLHKI